jgi:hypothetical protein
LGTRALAAFVLSAAQVAAFAAAPVAHADEPDADPTPPASTPDEVDAVLATYYPAPVDGPALRLPLTPTRLYVDAGFGSTDDLSALPYITGKARNWRFAAGGSWRWRGFALTGELPFVQVTTLDVDTVMNQPPIDADRHKTAASLGDLRLGADWTTHLGDALVGGVGLRTRLPTHTTHFDFQLTDGSEAEYVFPYYFHLEPTLILGGAFGRFLFVVNEGAVVLIGPDGDFAGFHITVPTIAYWDAAYAVAWAPLAALAASLELSTDIQLNHVAGFDFAKFNDVRSVWLAPALQWHVADVRVDLVARFGLTSGANLFGIMEYAGTTSYTLRVTRSF